MKELVLVLLFISGFFSVSVAQDSKLARDYFMRGEYEKAAMYYKKLYLQSKYNDYYFTYYFKSLVNDEKFEKAIDILDIQIKRKPKDLHLFVLKGSLYEKTNSEEKAEKSFAKAIKKIGKSNSQVLKIANEFKAISRYDLALKAYEKGVIESDNKTQFLYYIGNIYFLKGDNEKMINYYIAYMKKMDSKYNINILKGQFSRALDGVEYDSLRTRLVENIQENPDNILLIDMLSWTYLQLNQYKKSMRQIFAIDRRFNENGSRVFKFAIDAEKANEYSIAAKSYLYIIDNKKINNQFYLKSVKNYLSLTSSILVGDTSTTKSELVEIETKYIEFIDKFGISNRTADLVIELAKLEALYLGEVDKSISTLNDLVKRNSIDKEFKAKAKIFLGDFYLLKDEIWESSLLYSQVDKDFIEGELGELARFKNAQLYYYNGDFEWAQIIFNILKPATSRKISNDAIESSVFISETVGEDSTMIEPLKRFAKSELSIYQNNYNKAISSLDSINFQFPKSNLEDDIWYLKAQIFKKLKKYQLARKMYEQVIEKYPEELRADNALFELAQLNEEIFGDITTAKDLYEKLFLEYDNSTLAVEARKKYRLLNGDNVQ